MQGIVPFADKLNYSVPPLIISIKYFQVEALGAKEIPLGMNKIVIDLFIVFKLVIVRLIKGRTRIFGCDIIIAPAIIWLYFMHELIYSERTRVQLVLSQVHVILRSIFYGFPDTAIPVEQLLCCFLLQFRSLHHHPHSTADQLIIG